jgi:hypothetical protein
VGLCPAQVPSTSSMGQAVYRLACVEAPLAGCSQTHNKRVEGNVDDQAAVPELWQLF